MEKINELELRYRNCVKQYEHGNMWEEDTLRLLDEIDKVNREIEILLWQDKWKQSK